MKKILKYLVKSPYYLVITIYRVIEGVFRLNWYLIKLFFHKTKEFYTKPENYTKRIIFTNILFIFLIFFVRWAVVFGSAQYSNIGLGYLWKGIITAIPICVQVGWITFNLFHAVKYLKMRKIKELEEKVEAKRAQIVKMYDEKEKLNSEMIEMNTALNDRRINNNYLSGKVHELQEQLKEEVNITRKKLVDILKTKENKKNG